jgi:hypothetical protein
VSLAGWRLSDTPADPAIFIVQAGFTVPARGHLLVWADGQPEQSTAGGALHVSFRLGRDGETLTLSDPLGRVVDAVTFGAQATDVSQGRWPDGAPEPFFTWTTPTPGAANATVPDGLPEVRLLGVGVAADGGVALSWSSLPGRMYRIERRPALGAGAWEDAAPGIVAEGAVTRFEDRSGGATDARFYRVVLAP